MLGQLLRRSASLNCTSVVRQLFESPPPAMCLHSASCLLKIKDGRTSSRSSQIPKHLKQKPQQQQGRQPQQLRQRRHLQPQSQTQHHSQQGKPRQKRPDIQQQQQANNLDESKESKWQTEQPTEVQLIDKDGKNLGFLSLASAQEKARAENLLLQQVGKQPSTGHLIYKLMTAEQIQLKNKPKVQQKTEIRPDLKTKELTIRAGIGDNDLKFKMAKIQKFLDAPYEVKLEILKVRQGHEDANEVRAVPLKHFCRELLGKLDCNVDVKVVNDRKNVYRCIIWKVS